METRNLRGFSWNFDAEMQLSRKIRNRILERGKLELNLEWNRRISSSFQFFVEVFRFYEILDEFQ